MDPNIKITKKFTKTFGTKIIDRQYSHRKTGLRMYCVARGRSMYLHIIVSKVELQKLFLSIPVPMLKNKELVRATSLQ